MKNGVHKFNLRTLLAAIQGLEIPYIQSPDINTMKDFETYLSPQEPILVEDAKEVSNISSNTSRHETSRRDNKTLHNVSDSHDTTKFACFEIGSFTPDGILKLNAKDVKRCQKYFILFARNHSKFLKDRKNQLHNSRSTYVLPTHRPKISKRSKVLVKGLHEKLTENKIPHYELLLYKGKEYDKKREREKREKELSEIKNISPRKLPKSQNMVNMSKVHIYDILDEEIPSDLDLYKQFEESFDERQIFNFEIDNSLEESETFTSKLKNLAEEDSISQPKEGLSGYPILFVDINIGKNHIERITIYEGDDPDEVAKEFAETHNLNDKMFEKLKNMLEQQMAGILSRIKEEEYEEAGENNFKFA